MTSTLLGKAIRIAATVHEKQLDKGGKAYILHPLRVMMRLRTDDDEMNCIAVLHDACEDSEGTVTIESLRAEGFTERILVALDLLTRRKGQSYDEYIRKIATNRDAIRSKKDDLRDNGDITRLKGLRDQDFERIRRYHRAFVFLCKAEAAMNEVGY